VAINRPQSRHTPAGFSPWAHLEILNVGKTTVQRFPLPRRRPSTLSQSSFSTRNIPAYGLSAGKRVGTSSLQQPLAFCGISSIYVITRYSVDNLIVKTVTNGVVTSSLATIDSAAFQHFRHPGFSYPSNILPPRQTARRHFGNCRNNRNVTSSSIESAFSPFKKLISLNTMLRTIQIVHVKNGKIVSAYLLVVELILRGAHHGTALPLMSSSWKSIIVPRH
jgi:hypothetical protein